MDLTKMLRIMKLTAFLFLAACLHTSAKGWAQTITLSETNAPLKKVFTLIEKQAGVTFYYKEELLNSAKPVDIHVSNAPLTTVLDQCFAGQPFSYEIIGSTVVIKAKPPVPAPPQATPGAAPGDMHVRVTDSTGSPIAGATITILKLKKIGITNNKGEYILKNVPNGKYQAEITFIGYEKVTTEILVWDNKARIDVSMKQTSTGLDAIVVIPYGMTSQRLNTGDISTVTSKEIAQQPVGNVLAALEGRVPGLSIFQTTGNPGGAFSVQIRGTNSIQNGNDPFYVIDGVPYYSETPGYAQGYGLLNGTLNGGSPLNHLNPYDIESVEILKDADATAIYGSRAANGAILITTKKGKAGKLKVDLNVNTGSSSPARDITLMNTPQYLLMRHEAFKNDNKTPSGTTAPDLLFWDTTRYTNWSKTFLNNRPTYRDFEGSVSGGNVNTQWLIGGGYNYQTTGFPTKLSKEGGDKKGSIHINLNSQSSDKKFKISAIASYVSDINTVQIEDFGNDRITLPPDAPPIYNLDGSLNWAPMSPGLFGTWTNPYAILNVGSKELTSNLVGNTILSYELFRGLELKTSLGYTNTQTDDIVTDPSTVYDPAQLVAAGYSSFHTMNSHSWIVEPQINYRVSWGKGIFSALIGGSLHENNTKTQTLQANGFISDALLEDIQAANSVSVPFNASSQYKYNAIFGRLNYNWEDKYLLNVTTRRDGSSRFGPGKQFGNSGAIGAGWVFSRENFIQKKVPVLSFGKIRASYGTTGNDQVGDYQFLDLYNITTHPYATSAGLYPENLFNADLAWELDKKLEAGMELGFIKDRILLQVNVYRNRSNNQLVNSPVPLITGYSSLPENLPALVQNWGKEFIVHTTNIQSKNFTWSTSFNLSISKNKLLSFPQLATSGYSLIIGQPITIGEVYHMVGVNDTTGVYQFSDEKGNLTYKPNSLTDRIKTINKAPKFYGGLENSVSYKGISLDFLLQFVKQTGTNIVGAYTIEPGAKFNLPVAFLDRWQKVGDKKTYERLSESSLTNAGKALAFVRRSDFAFSDASFVRLKNLAISWQVPETWKQKMHLQDCRVYINAQNLITITKYNGVDPESQNIESAPKRIITAGFELAL